MKELLGKLKELIAENEEYEEGEEEGEYEEDGGTCPHCGQNSKCEKCGKKYGNGPKCKDCGKRVAS